MSMYAELRKLIAAPAFSALMVVSPLMAEEDAFDQRMETVVASLDAKQWDKALELLKGAEEQESAFKKGALLYHQGYATLQRGMMRNEAGRGKDGQADIEKAIELLTDCSKLAGGGEDVNVYQKRALLYLGAAWQSKGSYGRALKLYEQFLLERDQLRDSYDQGVMLVNLVICNSLSEEPDITEATDAFEDVLVSRERWNLTEPQVMRAMSAVVGLYIKQKKEDELLAFLTKIRANLVPLVNRDAETVENLVGIAGQASSASLFRASSMLLAALPVTQALLEESKVLLDDEREKEGEGLFLLGLKTDSPQPSLEPQGEAQIKALELFAYNAEQAGSMELARNGYQFLENHFPESKFRERDLYHLVRMCSALKDDAAVVKNASVYLSEYAQGEHRQHVRTLLADSFYQQGEHESVVKLYHDEIEQTSDFRADELLIAVRSAYLASRFADALKFVKILEGVEINQDSAQEIDYYKASCLARLQRWEAALGEIDNFQKKYGMAGEYSDLLQYEKAQCHFSLLDMEAAQQALGVLIAKGDGSKMVADAFNLLGNVQQAMRNREQAEDSYKKALEIGRSLKDDLLIQETLFYLVSLLGQETINDFKNKELAKALPYFEEFFRSYPDSDYAAQVAVAGMATMRDADRFNEYVTILQDVVIKMAEKDRTPGLELAMDTYIWCLQELGKTFDEVRDFTLGMHPPVRFSLVVKDAIARAYGRFDTKAEGKKEAVRSTVNDLKRRILMEDMIADYPLEDIAPYVMLNIAHYITAETTEPKRALPYYEAVMERGTIREGIEAEYGIAKILQSSGDEGSLARAQELLEDVLSRSTEDGLSDDVLSQIIEIDAQVGDWEAVTERAKVYMADKRYDRNRARVAYLQAFSYDQRGMREDAIAYYGQIYATYLNSLEVSAPAVERLVVLTWERNQNRETPATADRQVAYQLAHRYISLTEEEYNKRQSSLGDEARKAWQEIGKHVDQWEQSGEIKTVEQLLEDRRRGRKSFE